MGLSDIKDETYMVIYDKNDYKKMDILYPDGVSYKKTTYYTLSEIQKALSDD